MTAMLINTLQCVLQASFLYMQLHNYVHVHMQLSVFGRQSSKLINKLHSSDALCLLLILQETKGGKSHTKVRVIRL